MSVQKFGKWDLVGLITDNLEKDMDRAAKLSVRRFGLHAERLAHLHLQNQDLGWDALSPKYLARKVKQGFSELTLQRSTSMKQAITSWVEGYKAYAGVKRDATDKEGNSIASIAKTHEYGSLAQSIPPRPLWQPTFVEAAKWHVENNTPVKHFLEIIEKKYRV